MLPATCYLLLATFYLLLHCSNLRYLKAFGIVKGSSLRSRLESFANIYSIMVMRILFFNILLLLLNVQGINAVERSNPRLQWPLKIVASSKFTHWSNLNFGDISNFI